MENKEDEKLKKQRMFAEDDGVRSMFLYAICFVLTVLLFFSLMTWLEKETGVLYENTFLKQQGLQLLMARRAMEDHLELVIAKENVLASSVLPEYLNGKRDEFSVENSFTAEVSVYGDVLSCAYVPLSGSIPIMVSGQSPEGQAAAEFTRGLADRYWSEVYERDSIPYIPPFFIFEDYQMLALLFPVKLEGELWGKLVVMVDLRALVRRTVASLSFGQRGRACLLGDEGTIVFDEDHSRLGTPFFTKDGASGDDVEKMKMAMARSSHGGGIFRLSLEEGEPSSRKLISWDSIRIGGRNLVLLLSAPSAEVNAVLGQVRFQRHLLGGLLLMGIVVVSVFFFFLRDRRLLRDSARRLALQRDKLENVRRDLSEETRHLKALHDIVRYFANTRDRNRLFRRLMDFLIREVDFDESVIYANVDGELSILMEGRAQEAVPKENSMYLLARRTAEKRIVQSEENSGGGLITMAAPILFHDCLYGVLAVSRAKGLSGVEVNIFSMVAAHLASFWALNDLIENAEREATIDSLTCMWNRRYMMRKIGEEDVRIQRYGGLACVAISDLGNFKKINDRLGHLAGDEVMRKTAAILKKSIRSCDLVGRYGGDEFIFLLPGLTLEQGERAMDRLSRLVSLQVLPGGEVVVMDVGVASCPDSADSLMEAIGSADRKMYDNKFSRKELAEAARLEDIEI